MYNRTREGSNSAKLAGQACREGDKMATELYKPPPERAFHIHEPAKSTSHDV